MIAALFNGTRVDAVPAAHRGLHYGDGVFRTCLVYDERVLRFDEHYDRLAADARRLDLDAPARDLLRAETTLLSAGAPRAVLKMMLLRAGEERGYAARTRAVDRLLYRSAAPRHAPSSWTQGVRVGRAGVRLAAQPLLAGVKHLNRLEQVLAARACVDGLDEAIVEDDRGRPLAGTRTNLFWVRGGVLSTPALERCGVAGCMREAVLRSAQALGFPVDVTTNAEWTHVEEAEEVFLTNSVVGVWPVAVFETRRWTAPGPVTAAISTALAHPRLEA